MQFDHADAAERSGGTVLAYLGMGSIEPHETTRRILPVQASKANRMKPGHEQLTAEVIKAIRSLKYSFFSAYKFQEERLLELVELLQEADSRGIVVTEAVTLVDTSFWLQLVACNLTYVELLLRFAEDPGPKNLRALIQIHGPDRVRAKAQVAILDEQLQRRLARFANMPPDEAFALIRDNRRRVFAAYLHVRSGYGGTDLATMFDIPTGTAYEWLRWFDRLPAGLRESALQFIDREGFMLVANTPPTVAKQGPADGEAA